MVKIVRDVPLNSQGYVYVLEVFCMSVMSALSVYQSKLHYKNCGTHGEYIDKGREQTNGKQLTRHIPLKFLSKTTGVSKKLLSAIFGVFQKRKKMFLEGGGTRYDA